MTETAVAEGWSDDDLEITAEKYFGEGADADLPDPVRLVFNVGRLVLRRLEGAASGESEPSAFFLSPEPPAPADEDKLEPQPMLGSGRHELGGRFWFVGPAARRGVALSLEGWPERDKEVFDLACESLDIGEVPAVLFEARTESPELWFYPRGLADPESGISVPLSSESIDLDRIFEIIDRAHRDAIVTPQRKAPAGMKLWKNARRHHPVKQAEARIQYILRVALSAALPPTMVVREEQDEATGRIDLEIDERVPGAGIHICHALLELKVLRSYRSTGKPVPPAKVNEAIEEGVIQAKSYREAREALASALCCFDMRKQPNGSSCFGGVEGKARRGKVKLRVWPVYASVQQYRAANST